METTKIEPTSASVEQFLQRDNVRPLIVCPQITRPITQEHLTRKLQQLEPDELDAYHAIVSAGRIRDLNHLDTFCGSAGRFAEREPDVLACLAEASLIRYCSVVLAEGFAVSFFEPLPVMSEEAERLRIKASKETQADHENQAIVLAALIKAEAVATSTELKEFVPDGCLLTRHAITKTLKRLVELGQAELCMVEITPRKSVRCYAPVDASSGTSREG
jgi:hypothetical protein